MSHREGPLGRDRRGGERHRACEAGRAPSGAGARPGQAPPQAATHHHTPRSGRQGRLLRLQGNCPGTFTSRKAPPMGAGTRSGPATPPSAGGSASGQRVRMRGDRSPPRTSHYETKGHEPTERPGRRARGAAVSPGQALRRPAEAEACPALRLSRRPLRKAPRGEWPASSPTHPGLRFSQGGPFLRTSAAGPRGAALSEHRPACRARGPLQTLRPRASGPPVGSSSDRPNKPTAKHRLQLTGATKLCPLRFS